MGSRPAQRGIAVEDVLKELEDARLKASAGQMDDAKVHIDEALKLLNDAVTRSDSTPSARAANSYVTEARFATIKTDSRQAVAALDRALRALHTTPRTPTRLHKTLAMLKDADNMFVWLDTSGEFIRASEPLTEEEVRADMIAHGLPELEIEIRIASARQSPACALDQNPKPEGD
jgi:hypothetical protein